MTETLPYSWYTDPDVLAQERARLFSSAWQYAGHSGEMAEPGSYLTLQVGEVPLVIVRDREGTLRAFVNVCRHRGAEVVRGRGSCTTLQCHYHAWTYGLDGKLRAAPRSEADPGFDKDVLGLKPAQVDSWGPLIFVNADAAAPPLAGVPLVVAGDIDPGEARRAVEKWFSDVPRSAPVPPLSAPTPVLTSEKRETLEDQVQLPQLFLAWLTPPYFHPGDEALDVLARVLASGKNSRLYKRLVYDLQIAQDVSAFQSSGKLDGYFRPDPAKAAAVMRPSKTWNDALASL